MAFIYHIKAVFSEQNFAHVGAERQRNIQTNIQTYIHTHTLQKTISVNQARVYSQFSAGGGHEPGFKRSPLHTLLR